MHAGRLGEPNGVLTADAADADDEDPLTGLELVSYVQFQLLARLGDAPDGHHRMTDLADGVVYSRSGLTYQAQSLEQRGLVVRSPSPEDERSTVVSITAAGPDVLAAEFPGHIATVHGVLFDPLTDEDAADLARILGRVGEHLRASPPRSATRREVT
ncbi:MarR family transcriptional regulator [Labedella phragmitis]|uniref:MarR family transcriptional regulator n=1 Tax=Labedella phragmitis TaxID=2498849 RepID=A0A444PXA1_9MICO|nr:MarR family winged helix-turn-helix transcriptional regulator [Labedella phragmitis]RWZ52494.1 MarR family transcriptional regulator [Labedella phragmitis]